MNICVCGHLEEQHEHLICKIIHCGCTLFTEMTPITVPLARSGSPEFYALLEQMSSIHSKKSHDYAQASNPFSNFERAGTIASWFTDPVDIAFAVLIGVKLARLAELSTGKIPNNESIEDTHLDGATYMTLWAAYKKHKANG